MMLGLFCCLLVAGVTAESTCPFGHQLQDGDCEPCPKSWFRDPDYGSDVCEHCGEGFTTADVGTESAFDCVPDCLAGTYYAGTCEPCALGSYSEDNAWGCWACDAGLTTNFVGSVKSECIPDSEAEMPCPNGMYRNQATAACDTCPKNTYSLGGVKECTKCPRGTTSLSGSSSSYHCIVDPDAVVEPTEEPCGAGFFLINSICEICGENKYSMAGAIGECTDCPPGTISGRASGSIDDCIEIATEPQTEPPKLPTEPPKIETEPPKIVTEPPKVETEPPKVETEPPKVETEPPKVVTQPPKVETEPPKIITEAPKAVTEAPEVLTDPYKTLPVEPTELPTEPKAAEGDDCSVAMTADNSVTPILAQVGEALELDCSVGLQGVTYTWIKADRYTGSVAVNTGGGAKLTLSAVQTSEAGRYTCSATRDCPTDGVVSKSWSVGVQSPEKIEKSECLIYGDPHVKTFDGMMFDYQAECTYMLAMDCAGYSWYVYGLFGSCGSGTALESLTVFSMPQGDRYNGARFELKRGFAVNEDGFLKGVKEGETLIVKDATITFDGKLMKVALAGVDIYWDGLTFAKIVVAKGSKTCGVCADNNGYSGDDVSAGMYSSANFADTWAINPTYYGCKAGTTHPLPSDKNMGMIRKIFVSEKSPVSLLDEAFLTELGLATFVQHAAMDMEQNTQSIFKDSRISPCQVVLAFLDVLQSNGVYVDRLDIDIECPDPHQVRSEAIGLGCPWSQNNIPFLL